jgi:hypothetical protein
MEWALLPGLTFDGKFDGLMAVVCELLAKVRDIRSLCFSAIIFNGVGLTIGALIE